MEVKRSQNVSSNVGLSAAGTDGALSGLKELGHSSLGAVRKVTTRAVSGDNVCVRQYGLCNQSRVMHR